MLWWVGMNCLSGTDLERLHVLAKVFYTEKLSFSAWQLVILTIDIIICCGMPFTSTVLVHFHGTVGTCLSPQNSPTMKISRYMYMVLYIPVQMHALNNGQFTV